MIAHVPQARRSDAWWAFAVALAARLGVVAWARARFPPVADGFYYDVLAHRLASGVGYTWLWPDGSVTFAAHYPVGYPGMLAVAYRIFGGSPAVATTVNAVVGAASAYAVHRLVDGPGVARWRPMTAALVVGLHPGLLAYTAAFMTEGVTSALLAIAAAFAARARRVGASALWLVGCGCVFGLATLVRPQSFVLVTLAGFLAAPATALLRERLVRAFMVTAVAGACVVPWTVRNCVRMGRCAPVSVNEGWNLLIGATTENGGWAAVTVPSACKTVWDEACKDTCFKRAALDVIASAPVAWLERAPAKIAMTLDYIGGAPWYLNASNPSAFSSRSEEGLAVIETLTNRALLVAALLACAMHRGSRSVARRLVCGVGALSALGVHGWLGYMAIAASVMMSGWRSVTRRPLVLPLAAAVIGATIVTHAVFFGAGRYGMVVIPFVAAVAFVGRG